MRKNKVVLLLAALMLFLTTGITALAASVPANCPSCAAYGVVATLKSQGEHLWHRTGNHTVDYSDENGVLHHEACTISYSEDKVSWVCPNGHGTVASQVHHVENHSSSHCNSLDYYY